MEAQPLVAWFYEAIYREHAMRRCSQQERRDRGSSPDVTGLDVLDALGIHPPSDVFVKSDQTVQPYTMPETPLAVLAVSEEEVVAERNKVSRESMIDSLVAMVGDYDRATMESCLKTYVRRELEGLSDADLLREYHETWHEEADPNCSLCREES